MHTRSGSSEQAISAREVCTPSLHDILGKSASIEHVKELVRMVAQNHSTVLITGESGVGKELIARTIHRLSDRSDKPFVPTNCGALPETLLESQLFGHEKGTFTGAVQSTLGIFRAADRGTVFLDEITEMSPALQVKLLRVLQEREVTPVGGVMPVRVNVRIIAATNRPLEELVDERILRRDLFYRLSVVQVAVPPLSHRREDIDELVLHFIHRHAIEYGREPVKLTDEARGRLIAHGWPGNVRELSNTIERMYALGLGPVVSAGELSLPLSTDGASSNDGKDSAGLPSWEEAEQELIRRALEAARGQKTVAARLLQIDRHRLARKIKKYQLDS